ncbi:MAG: hypothetical protein HYV07_00900 [Deltaproteobacteria bacterium]|nr:hypothetical protein [Deltaproteobacteria bacterium]
MRGKSKHLRSVAFITLALSLASDASAERLRARASHPRPPEWTSAAPSPSAESLYFVGFAAGHASLADAKEAAAKKALGEIVAYLGQAVRSSFRSVEVERSGQRSYSVAAQLELEGRVEELRGVTVLDTYWEEWVEGRQRTYEAHALVRFPRAEHARVLEARRESDEAIAKSAHVRFVTASRDARADRPAAAAAGFAEALDLLAKLTRPVMLPGTSVASSDVLLELIRTEARVVEDELARRRRRVAVSLDCLGLARLEACSRIEAELLASIRRRGFDPWHRAPATSTATTAGGWWLEARLEAEPSTVSSGIHFSGASGVFQLGAVGSRLIVKTGAVPRQKGAHVTDERAREAAASALGRILAERAAEALGAVR